MREFLHSSKGEIRVLAAIIALIATSVMAPKLILHILVGELARGHFSTANCAADPPEAHGTVEKGPQQARTNPVRGSHNAVRTIRTDTPAKTRPRKITDGKAEPYQPRQSSTPGEPCSPFDPNRIDSVSLVQWGVNSYAASNIMKYRRSGGKFYDKEDLLKIYGMDRASFSAMEQCLVFDRPKHKGPPVDLNSATQEDLVRLPGIGDRYASRILKFRDALGGFYSIDQVGETYGLPAEAFDAVRQQLALKTPHRRLEINKVGTDSLAAHAYVSWREAKAIALYVRNHGKIRSMEQLLRIPACDTSRMTRLEPYLDFR